MIKSIIEKLPVTTIFITFFFICGGLYLIGFWSTFGVDISSFVSLADIPKSFILPFVLAQGFFAINFFMILTFSKDFIEKPSESNLNNWKRFIDVFFSLKTALFISLIIILFRYTKHGLDKQYWIESGLVVSILLSITLVRSAIFQTYIPSNNLRLYVTSILVFVPISSFVIGKVSALNIYHSTDGCMYIITPTLIANADEDQSQSNHSNQPLKFLGFLGDKLIASSLDNKKIVFLNQSAFDEVTLSKQKPAQEINSRIKSTK